MLLKSVTAPQAVRTCSRPTRIIQIFVVGEKYLTGDSLELAHRQRVEYVPRTSERISDRTPPRVSKIIQDTLFERSPDILARDLCWAIPELVRQRDGPVSNRNQLDEQPAVLKPDHDDARVGQSRDEGNGRLVKMTVEKVR
jgi:hypothetical protein